MRILVVSEYHILNTGYAAYYKNICEALHTAGHEVFELASYGNANLQDHVRAANKCPWTVYLNIPNVNDTEEWNFYNDSRTKRMDTDFGSWKFENTVLQCWPDVVIAIRDHWYDKFIMDSPLAKYYTVILSPTCDSRPQRYDWIDTFQKVDILTFYTQWSENWIKTQCNTKNIVDHIAPAPNSLFKPLDKLKCREKLGISHRNKILLTVMRNQPRKQYPALFEAFSKLKDKSIVLYCHTHSEDRGWDIPKLILQNGIADRVYFTYKCTECFNISTDIFKIDNICEKCKSRKEICTVQDGASIEELNIVYNCADLYVQWANSEGFGIPLVEAAAAGIKTITVDYSAPEDIVTKTESFAIAPLALNRELGTLCNRAVPDNNALIDLLNNEESWIYNREEVTTKLKDSYNWEKTGREWVALVESVIPKNKWAESPTLIAPPSFDKIKDLPIFEFVKSCILDVYQDEDILGTVVHCEALDHLESGFFIPENKTTNVKENVQKSVTKEMVYGKFYNLLEHKVKWERKKNELLCQKN